jgi:hypothetical protein
MGRLEPHLRPLFLQQQEARARREGDLEILREIKAYKALVSSPTTSNPTSTTPRPTD